MDLADDTARVVAFAVCALAACSSSVIAVDSSETTSGTSAADSGAAETLSGNDSTSQTPAESSTDQGTSDTTGTTGTNAECGDGVITGLEQCDDGNSAPADGCEPGCLLGSGEVVWAVEVDGGDDDVAYDLLVRDDGNIIAVGSRRADTGLDTWIAVYDPAGTPISEVIADFGEGDHDESLAISPLGLGYVLAGIARTAGDNDVDDALLVAVDSEFEIVWSRRIDGGLDDRANAVATAPSSIAVAGHRESDGPGEDAWFAVYDTSGNEQWSRTDDGPDSRTDDARGIAWLTDGGLVVVGEQAVNSQVDLWISARDADGSERWSELLDFQFGDDVAVGVTVDGGDILVTGSIASALTNSEELWVGRFAAADGTPGPVLSFNSAGFLFDGGEDAVVVDDAVFVAGVTAATDQQRNALVGRWPSAGGEALWTDAFDGGPGLSDAGHAIAVLGDGSVVAAGEVTVLGQGTNAWIRRWAP